MTDIFIPDFTQWPDPFGRREYALQPTFDWWLTNITPVVIGPEMLQLLYTLILRLRVANAREDVVEALLAMVQVADDIIIGGTDLPPIRNHLGEEVRLTTPEMREADPALKEIFETLASGGLTDEDLEALLTQEDPDDPTDQA